MKNSARFFLAELRILVTKKVWDSRCLPEPIQCVGWVGVDYNFFYLNIKCLLTYFYQKKLSIRVTFVKKAIKKRVTFVKKKLSKKSLLSKRGQKSHLYQRVVKKWSTKRVNFAKKESHFYKVIFVKQSSKGKFYQQGWSFLHDEILKTVYVGMSTIFYLNKKL